VTPHPVGWTILFLGTGSYDNTSARSLAGLRIEIDGFTALVGCADGTLERLSRARHGWSIDAVLLTDTSSLSIAGLVGVAEARARHGVAPLRVLGPPGTLDVLDLLSEICRQPRSTLFDAHEVEIDRSIEPKAGLYLHPFALSRAHDDPGLGWILFEAPVRGRFDRKKVEQLGLAGADFAALEGGNTVRGIRPSDVMGPGRGARRIVIAGRTRPSPEVADAMEGADVAVLEAPFLDDRLDVAEAAHALTGWEAAEMATRAGTRMLLLTQMGSYASHATYIAEARPFHANLHGPSDLDRVVVPHPENGLPYLAPKAPTRPSSRPGIRRGQP